MPTQSAPRATMPAPYPCRRGRVPAPGVRTGSDRLSRDDARPVRRLIRAASIPVVDDEIERRVASNEAVFREVNESIASGRWPGDEAAVAFRCECAQLGCDVLINLPVLEYERVRAHPRRFIVAAGHQAPEVETVVEAFAGYLVVQKRGEGGRVAEESDPRR